MKNRRKIINATEPMFFRFCQKRQKSLGFSLMRQNLTMY